MPRHLPPLLTIILFVSTALSASLAACSTALPLSPSPIPSPSASPSPQLTPTSTPEPTKTPEPAQPDAPHGLSAVNAASQTYENGQWVVKNAAGEITATYTQAADGTGEWVYNYENIKLSVAFIATADLNIPEEFIKPSSRTETPLLLTLEGKPARPGTVVDKFAEGFPYSNQGAFIVASLEGYITFPTDRADMFIYRIELASDKFVIAGVVYNDNMGGMAFPLIMDDLSSFNIGREGKAISFTGGEMRQLLKTVPRGTQFLIFINYHFPEDAPDYIRREDPLRSAIVAAIKAGQLPQGDFSSLGTAFIGLAIPQVVAEGGK